MQPKRLKKNVSHFIASEFNLRLARNPNYSLRAFARDLEMPPSTLSRILTNKRQPSPKMALAILDHLYLAPELADEYRALILHSHSPRQKRSRLAQAPQIFLTAAEFSRICSWHSLALLELLRIPGIEGTEVWLAKALKTSRKEIKVILSNLEDLGFVRREGLKFYSAKSDVFYKGASATDPLVFRHFHDIIRHLYSLKDPQTNRVHSTSEALAVRRADVPRIAAMMKPFVDRVRRDFAQVPDTDSLYQLMICLFPIFEPDEKSGRR